MFLGLFFFCSARFFFFYSLSLSFVLLIFFGNSEFFFFHRLRSFVFLVCSTSPCSTAFFSIAFSFVTLQTTLRVEHGLDRVLLGYFTEFFSVDGMARALEAIRRRRSNFKEKKKLPTLFKIDFLVLNDDRSSNHHFSFFFSLRFSTNHGTRDRSSKTCLAKKSTG